MNTYFTALFCGAILYLVTLYTPRKRKPDWRPLDNAQRFEIYEMSRFALLGDRDLHHNLVREIEGRKAKEEFMEYMQERKDGQA